ncbi:MAG: adenylyl-sulfate kinase [Candidatus Angelobacter sp.]
MITTTHSADSRGLLRFLTAGSVDDGKSTLIGRLLHDSGAVYEDELASMAKRSSANGHKFDPSLVTDGLKAEREQGITIDVAYRYFSTPRRKFIIADTPGHEQYTRNMITGASTAQTAVLLMDARKGVLPQTRRHTYIVWLLGIRSIIVALNKMDLVGFDPAIYEKLKQEFLECAASLNFHEIQFVPVSALDGDNIIAKSERMPWYDGPFLLEALESIETHDDPYSEPFRLPVQTVIRSNQDFRGYGGQIVSGKVRSNQELLVLPSERYVTVDEIDLYEQKLGEAFAPMSVLLSLKEHTDLGRGDMLCDPQYPPAQAKRFRAKLVWMSPEPLKIGEPYLLKHTTQTACMSVLSLLHKTDIHTLEEVPADSLQLNEIGEVEIETHKPIFCDPYAVNKATGNFIVIHPTHNATVAGGIILQPHKQAANDGGVSLSMSNGNGTGNGLTIWITGLSGAGKTTICQAVHTELLARGIRAETLDGDVIRKHLSRDLGYTKSERNENIRRIGFVAQLLTRNGVAVLVSAISPYRAIREEIRANIGNFIEVFANAPLEVCEQRDPKGLYSRARAGQFQGFTGIDDPYEPPVSPEVECRTDLESTKESVDKVVAAILKAI